MTNPGYAAARRDRRNPSIRTSSAIGARLDERGDALRREELEDLASASRASCDSRALRPSTDFGALSESRAAGSIWPFLFLQLLVGQPLGLRLEADVRPARAGRS